MKSVALILFLLLAGCAGEQNLSVAPGADETLVEVRDGGSEASAANPSLYSYRRFLFAKPLRGINSSEHYILEARFIAGGSKLILHDHFMGFEKRDGVELSLERKEEDLLVRISTPGRQPVVLDTLAGVFTNGPFIRLRVELHDGVTSGTHALVWLNDINLESARSRPLDTLTKASAQIDSEERGFVSSASGRGIFAGLELWSVEVVTARRDLPYVLE